MRVWGRSTTWRRCLPRDNESIVGRFAFDKDLNTFTKYRIDRVAAHNIPSIAADRGLSFEHLTANHLASLDEDLWTAYGDVASVAIPCIAVITSMLREPDRTNRT
jgi:hypothetical protein